MIEGICPDCGGYLYEDTTRGEYGWLTCDTCDYSVNIISGREEREENDNGEHCTLRTVPRSTSLPGKPKLINCSRLSVKTLAGTAKNSMKKFWQNCVVRTGMIMKR